jgi:hypothetical protein
MVNLLGSKKPFGKKRSAIKNCKDKIILSKEFWPCNGQKERFKEIFFKNLKKKPFNFLIKLGKEKPNVMFLGAGKGDTILEFLKHTSKFKIKPIVDVFSLTKGLSKNVLTKVRKDYSTNIAFEELNIKNSKYKFLENKYDLIVGAMSVGYHTKYPTNAIFTSALMLKKGGKAYVEIDDLKSFLQLNKNEFWKFLKYSTINKEEIYSQKQILVLEKIFNRMVNVYNPKLEFTFNFINYKNKMFNNVESVFVEIERLN